MPSLYTFTDYSPDWPLKFQQEAAQLQGLLGEELIAIHHIGSTSVPGLAAKPIIDLLPVVQRVERIDDLTAKLQAAGYKPWGEYGLPGRRYFTKDRDGYRTHNIHMYQVNNPEIERHLAFCAFLRTHESIRHAYAALKREVYERHPKDIDAYNDGKTTWIKQIESSALKWYRQQAR
ncbi:MAG: GrpB family protein [Leptolyngbya sp. SIO1E4]|nr:GrpB family protein [Leptolyngbya sp. SIO1E4]